MSLMVQHPRNWIASLLPAGVAADGATGKAANNLAGTGAGMRSVWKSVRPSSAHQLVPTMTTLRLLVGETRPREALVVAYRTKALQSVLGQLIQVASQSSPTAAPAPSALVFLLHPLLVLQGAQGLCSTYSSIVGNSTCSLVIKSQEQEKIFLVHCCYITLILNEA
jgi:hypothetical protein